MIIGIGSDLTDIRRIERAFSRFGDRFASRVFTKEEQGLASYRREMNQHFSTYAKRWAAKEACAKALGVGFAQGIYMKDIGVIHDSHGRPCIVLSGGAQERLNSITPDGKTAHIHLTFSDEPPLAQAFVIIEAR